MPTEVNEVMPGQTSELLKPAIRRQQEYFGDKLKIF